MRNFATFATGFIAVLAGLSFLSGALCATQGSSVYDRQLDFDDGSSGSSVLTAYRGDGFEFTGPAGDCVFVTQTSPDIAASMSGTLATINLGFVTSEVSFDYIATQGATVEFFPLHDGEGAMTHSVVLAPVTTETSVSVTMTGLVRSVCLVKGASDDLVIDNMLMVEFPFPPTTRRLAVWLRPVETAMDVPMKVV